MMLGFPEAVSGLGAVTGSGGGWGCGLGEGGVTMLCRQSIETMSEAALEGPPGTL